MPDWSDYHQKLLADVRARAELDDPRVLAALEAVPRHLFLPAAPLAEAYADEAQPLSEGQTISQPSLVAWMSQLLELDGSERVLEIGTGSGYQTAILSRLAREVWSIERHAGLGRRAAALLERLGCRNVRLRVGDGYAGWPEAAPFDRVLLTAAPPRLPRALETQLREGGILVAPLGNERQQLIKGIRHGDEVYARVVTEVRFVPMLPGSPAPG